METLPDRLGGAWVLRGTRMPVATIFENLEDLSITKVMEQFDVTREEITALLDFAAQSSRVLRALKQSLCSRSLRLGNMAGVQTIEDSL